MLKAIGERVKSIFRIERRSSAQLHYVVDSAEWSIYWDGKYITEGLKSQGLMAAKIVRNSPRDCQGILHFGARNLFLPHHYKKVKARRIVFTWFHGMDTDVELVAALPFASRKASIVHTSCTTSRDDLVRWGVPESKIEIVPLGVDLNVFKPSCDEEKKHLRARLGIPDDCVVVGSFQKDGNGWGEGNEAKTVKGPDVFCDVIKNLATSLPVHVLLTGPARGFVKRQLEAAGISYSHAYLEDYGEIAEYYRVLDLYLISARAEGGPKAVLEGMASGVPIVSTKVGMAIDVIETRRNGILADVDDVEGLTEGCREVLSNDDLRRNLISEGLNTALSYDWQDVARRYYEQIYSKLS